MRRDASENSQICRSTTVRASAVRVAVGTPRLSCRKAGKAQKFTQFGDLRGIPGNYIYFEDEPEPRRRRNCSRDTTEILFVQIWCEVGHGRTTTKLALLLQMSGNVFGTGATGVCPAGGTHDPSQSPQYTLNDRVGIPGFLEDDWWQCNKCQGLFFGGDWGTGHCPAGGGHDGTGSDEISLDSGTDPSQHQQTGWARCSKCEGLFFYANNFLFSGTCPAGGGHTYYASEHYSVTASRNLAHVLE